MERGRARDRNRGSLLERRVRRLPRQVALLAGNELGERAPADAVLEAVESLGGVATVRQARSTASS